MLEFQIEVMETDASLGKCALVVPEVPRGYGFRAFIFHTVRSLQGDVVSIAHGCLSFPTFRRRWVPIPTRTSTSVVRIRYTIYDVRDKNIS